MLEYLWLAANRGVCRSARGLETCIWRVLPTATKAAGGQLATPFPAGMAMLPANRYTWMLKSCVSYQLPVFLLSVDAAHTYILYGTVLLLSG